PRRGDGRAAIWSRSTAPGGGRSRAGGRTSGCERGLRLLGELAERLGVAHGQVGENLAVEFDVPGLEARDELVVREAVRTCARVDADDPEATELALLVLAIAVRVDERVLDLLLRVRVVRALEAPVALRLLENLAALLARVDGTLDAGHRLPLSKESLDNVR